MKSKRSMSAIVAVMLIGGLIYPGTARAAAESCGSNTEVNLDTFEVSVEAARRVYKPGQVARLTVIVNRYVHGTPVSEPAEGISVLSYGRTEEFTMVGGGMTDADGRTDVSLRIRKNEPGGWVEVFTFAARSVARAPCISVNEYGSVREKRLFRIKR